MASNKNDPRRAFVEAFDALIKADPEIKDLWDGIHDIPSEEDIETGPDTGARGGAVERMFEHYSEEAPQEGIHKEYAEFFSKLFDKQLESLKSDMEDIKAGLGVLVKAHIAKAGDPVKVAAREVEKALRHVGRVEAAVEAGTATKEDLVKAETAVDRARVKLEFHKGQLDGTLEDSIIEQYEAVMKAEEEEDDEKEEKKEKEAKKANPSHDAGGKFAPKEGGKEEDEEEDEGKEEAKSDEIAQLITATNGKIAELEDMVAQLSSAKPRVPTMKASKEVIEDAPSRLSEALAKGVISEDSAFEARRLISRWQAVQNGNLAESTFNAELAVQKPEVRELFTKTAN